MTRTPSPQAKAELQALFDAHVQAPFPSGGTPATAALKGDLVEYDSRVAGHVSSLLGGQALDRDLLAPDAALDAALAAADGDEFVAPLRAYKHLVDALAQAALKLVG